MSDKCFSINKARLILPVDEAKRLLQQGEIISMAAIEETIGVHVFPTYVTRVEAGLGKDENGKNKVQNIEDHLEFKDADAWIVYHTQNWGGECLVTYTSDSQKNYAK